MSFKDLTTRAAATTKLQQDEAAKQTDKPKTSDAEAKEALPTAQKSKA